MVEYVFVSYLDTAEGVSMATTFRQHTWLGLSQMGFTAQETRAEPSRLDEFYHRLLTRSQWPTAQKLAMAQK